VQYVGSKARFAKEILPIVLAGRAGELYVEPFVGGGNSFHLVDGPKLGNDVNSDVVAMLEAVGAGWVPPGDVSEAEYREARLGGCEPHVRGFIGVGCSYGGKFFGGYARGRAADGSARNYARESRDNVLRQAAGLAGACWSSVRYWELDIPDGSFVYCDPPYAGVTGYGDVFDSVKFWEWAEGLSARCRVFVSEYVAPAGWCCVWSGAVVSGLRDRSASSCKRPVERLFRLKGVGGV